MALYARIIGLANGSVAEWLKALVSKTSVRETVPRVQISPLPQIMQ